MFRLNKKAVSEIVAYALLISISLSLAGMVFIWLKNYMPQDTSSIECEENIGLIIKDYYYSCDNKTLNLTLENKGLFDIAGYVIRVNNFTLAKIGIYTLNKTGKFLFAGEVHKESYLFANQTDELLPKPIGGYLTFVEVQPFLVKEGKKVYCSNFVSKQTLSCIP